MRHIPWIVLAIVILSALTTDAQEMATVCGRGQRFQNSRQRPRRHPSAVSESCDCSAKIFARNGIAIGPASGMSSSA